MPKRAFCNELIRIRAAAPAVAPHWPSARHLTFRSEVTRPGNGRCSDLRRDLPRNERTAARRCSLPKQGSTWLE